MPFVPYRRFRRPMYRPRTAYSATRRSFTRRPYTRVRGLPSTRLVRSNSSLTCVRAFTDQAFLGIGSGSTIANVNYGNPSTQITYLTATSSDFPSSVGSYQCGFSCQWTCADIIGYNDFFQLFQQFQIRKLDVTFTMMNGSAYNATQANPVPSLAVCYDPNDSGVPADYTTITAFENHRVFQFSDSTPSFTYSFVPKVAQSVYRSALLTAYGASNSNASMWLDADGGASCPFYGMKGWFRNFNCAVTNGLSIRMEVKAHLAWRLLS